MSGVSVNVSGNASAAITVLDDFRRKAESTAEKIANGFKQRIGQRMFDGLIRAANALPNAMKGAIDAGGRLSDHMARTGAAGEGLVVLERAFKNAGMSADSTTRLLGMMQKGLGGINEDMQTTSEAFAVLGLSMEDLRAKDPVAAFEEIGSAIMRIQDPAQRAALAMRIFGRSGTEALVMFSDRGAMEQARKELGQFPGILSENAQALDMVSDRLNNMGTGWQQIGAAAAVAILPALEEITSQLQAIDFTGIGTAIGAVLNLVSQFAPHLIAIGLGLTALKLVSFIGMLKKKTMDWWAATAAVKANTAALKENAAAGGAAAAAPGPRNLGRGAATAAGGPRNLGRGAAIAAGGALAVAGIGAQLAMNYANDLATANNAMQESFDRGNAAMKKFEIGAIRAQVASRAEIEATIEAIEEEKQAIFDAAEAQQRNIDDPELRQRLMDDTATTIKRLDLKARQIRATSDEQIAANAASRDAAIAAQEEAEATRKAAEAYAKARAEYQQKLAFADEKVTGKGSLQDQLAEIDKAEGAIRSKIKGIRPEGTAADLIRNLDRETDSQQKTDSLQQALKLAGLEEKRADLLSRIREEEAAILASKKTAAAEYQEEMAILQATIVGNREKVADLEREAEIRREIARLVQAGFDKDDPTLRPAAEQLVKNRQDAEAAIVAKEKAREQAERVADAEARAAEVVADARAAAGGEDRTKEKRTKELIAQGVDPDRAADMSANESSLESITGLRNQADGMQFQSNLGAVSSMQRIGGGGGAASSGLDYSRQQTDIQRQIAQELRAISSRIPLPTLEN